MTIEFESMPAHSVKMGKVVSHPAAVVQNRVFKCSGKVVALTLKSSISMKCQSGGETFNKWKFYFTCTSTSSHATTSDAFKGELRKYNICESFGRAEQTTQVLLLLFCGPDVPSCNRRRELLKQMTYIWENLSLIILIVPLNIVWCLGGFQVQWRLLLDFLMQRIFPKIEPFEVFGKLQFSCNVSHQQHQFFLYLWWCDGDIYLSVLWWRYMTLSPIHLKALQSFCWPCHNLLSQDDFRF